MTGACRRNGSLAGNALALLLTVSVHAAQPVDETVSAMRRLPPVDCEAIESPTHTAMRIAPSPTDPGKTESIGLALEEDAFRASVTTSSPLFMGAERANSGVDAQAWMDDYGRWVHTAIPAKRRWLGDQQVNFPPDVRPWWDARVKQPIDLTGEPVPIDIATLTERALQFSSFVHVVVADPNILQTELVEQVAAFDWRVFLESTYNDVNEPIGNTLTTGTNADRYLNRTWSIDSGLRRKNSWGGEVELFQRYGTQADNSRFLAPNPQGTSRLELQFTQPLLKGSGRAYNESRIVLAQIRVDQSKDEVAQQLETHLVKVTEAYWELYRTRAELHQRMKLLRSAKRILDNLEARREVDAVQRQVFRARSAVANRKSELVRAETRVRNWQSQLRLLVNDPLLVQWSARELTPVDSPLLADVALSMSDSLQTALLNRPDISRAIRGVRRVAVELGIAQQDVLPKLDFVASAYAAGLAGARNNRQAFSRQFSDGRPTYSLGLEFEVPISNRAAKAQVSRREWEMSKAMNRFRLTVEEALTTVEIAVREVETNYIEMLAKHQAMQAAQNETDYLDDRWQILPGGNDSAAQLLENLLDAQERLADEEGAMVRTQVEYVLAVVRLKREMGTLLRVGIGQGQ